MLTTADRLLADTSVATIASRHRGAAFALRSALETAVSDALLAAPINTGGGSMRAEFLCLRSCADADIARRAKAVWGMLSVGCHYHHYELGPTAHQLRAWQAEVRTLLSFLST
nr:hypothetical protein [Streptomyces sp. SID3343]